MERYLIIVERTPSGYSAYSPDLPGCIATSESRTGIVNEMKGAIELHISGLRLEGMPVPKAETSAMWVEVAA